MELDFGCLFASSPRIRLFDSKWFGMAGPELDGCHGTYTFLPRDTWGKNNETQPSIRNHVGILVSLFPSQIRRNLMSTVKKLI